MNDTVSVVMPIYNQEKIIARVVKSVAENISDNVKEAIFIFDGCTDNTEEEFNKVKDLFKIPLITFSLPNVNEVKSNNAGIKKSSCKYSLTIQDDCLIREKYFDKRLLKPFKLFPNLLAVSGRDAVDIRIINDDVNYYNVVGKDVRSPRNIFYIRDIVNRTPLMLDNEKMKELNYFDEDFAPIGADDTDLSLRAYRKGYWVGSFWIEYDSPLSWGKTRDNPVSYSIFEQSIIKNHKMIIERHKDLIEEPKHDMDITIYET
jgi:glycosyltransferase involved in cell wall biosynthesis